MPRTEFGLIRNFTPEEAARAVVLYLREEMSLTEVARELKSDPSSIAKLLRRHGIRRRTSKEWADILRRREAAAVQNALNGGAA